MKVSILMGSKSDYSVVEPCLKTLKELDIPYEVRVLSAHRTPDKVVEYVRECQSEVFIAAAGGAAHLAGVIAANTTQPVIGIPVANTLQGFDSLLSTVQMPPGTPVATVGVNNAMNAALLAAQMLSLRYAILQEKLSERKIRQMEKVLADDKEIQSF